MAVLEERPLSREERTVYRAISLLKGEVGSSWASRIFSVGGMKWRIWTKVPAKGTPIELQLVVWRHGSDRRRYGQHGGYSVLESMHIPSLDAQEVLSAIGKIVAQKIHEE